LPRRLRFHADFQRDLDGQLSWLAKHRGLELVGRLREGLDEALDLLHANPGVGSRQDARGSRVMRKLILRRLPFLIWYLLDDDDPDGDVWVLRLFHVRQNRPRRR
jgi:plasmid stabilization system protein ParE